LNGFERPIGGAQLSGHHVKVLASGVAAGKPAETRSARAQARGLADGNFAESFCDGAHPPRFGSLRPFAICAAPCRARRFPNA
jgi:hypothetical protein